MSIDIHTLAGAYALDAVNDLERVEFARHLTVCPSCAQEHTEFRETVARLTSASALTPPVRLKPAVLAEVARTRQVPPGRRAPDTSSRPAGRRGWRAWTLAAAAAAVIAASAGTVGYAISDQRVRDDRAAIVAAQQQAARISAVLSAPDASLHVEHIAGGGTVTVVVAPSRNAGVATLTDMPALPPAKTYQLWLIHGDTPVSAGVLAETATSGTTFLTNVRGATAFGVSAEAAGGASKPSLPLVTSFSLGS